MVRVKTPKRAGPTGATKPWQLPLSAWRDVVVRSWQDTSENNLRLIAGGVAFFGFLAIIPAIVTLVLIYGLLVNTEAVTNDTQAISAVLPPGVGKLINDQLARVLEASGRDKLLALAGALIVAVWGARKAAIAVICALNIAYHEKEERGFLALNLLATGIIASAALLILLSMAAATVLFYVERLMSGLNRGAGVTVTVGSYLGLGIVAALTIAALYRYGPSRKEAKWEWVSTGSLFAAVSWLALTFLFGLYVANFGRYDEVYGSLGAVVVLLLWIYMSSFLLIFGAQLNGELEQQTRADTTKGTTRPEGERGAYAADHVAGDRKTSRRRRKRR